MKVHGFLKNGETRKGISLILILFSLILKISAQLGRIICTPFVD
jgi:hypothetical protein